MTFEVSERQERDVMVLHMDGRLDAATSPLIERKVDAFIEAGQRKFILNFEQVDYLSSAGMRFLLSVTKKLDQLEGKMVLASVSPEVMEVMRMAGFDRLLHICHTEPEALGVFE